MKYTKLLILALFLTSTLFYFNGCENSIVEPTGDDDEYLQTTAITTLFDSSDDPDNIFANDIAAFDDVRTIEDEIKTNESFRNEYEEIKSSFSFLNEVRLEEPPEHYFSTLLPKINERLEATHKHEEISIWEKLFSYWKFAIPVVPIILIFIILKIDIFNPDETLKKGEPNKTIIKEKEYNNIIKEETKDIAVVNEDNNKDTETNISQYQISRTSYDYEYTETKNDYDFFNQNNTSYIDDYLEEVGNYYDDEYLFEEDYEGLSTEEQNEIITKLKEEDF